MAAAALLRSMARKLARAPPPPSPHHLAGGLHGGARSGPGGSLPPLMAAAAAAGLRSGAALPSSLATKIARAPPQPPHHRHHILNRGLHTAPPTTTSDKDKVVEDLRLRLWHSRAAARMSAVILSGVAIYGYFWLLPAMKKARDRYNAMEKLLRDVITAHDEDSLALAQIIKTAAGHMKQQRDGTTETGTRVDKSQEDVMEVCIDIILKETEAILDGIRADIKESRAAIASMSKAAPSEHKEGRVGSETVSS